MKRLMLTSPMTKGNEVRNLQMGLKDNHYGDFLHGTVDGQFGVLTAQAVYRAKYWLGFRHPDQVGGPDLRLILAGKEKLGPVLRTRREYRLAKRAKAIAARPLRVKALEFITHDIGMTEHPPESNICVASTWYGMPGQPWCAMEATYAYVRAGSKAFLRGVRYHYVPTMVADAIAGRNHLTITHDPQPGDLVTYDWDGDGVADHVGLFHSWNGPGRVAFTAIEGNTSGTSNSNGGIVMKRPDRLIGEVRAFIHVGA